MTDHAQLTAREIHGPFTQLFTNLQGNKGAEWLEALRRFLRKENPWSTGSKMHGTECIPALTVLVKEKGNYEIGPFIVPLGEDVRERDVYLLITELDGNRQGRIYLGGINHYESEPGRSSIWVRIIYPDGHTSENWLGYSHNKPEGRWELGGGF